MKKTRELLILVGVLVVLAVLFVPTSNRLVSLKEEVKLKLADVEVALQERSNSIRNLVETTKGAAEHEEVVYASITGWADALDDGIKRQNVDDINNANKQLVSSVGNLLAIAQNYPELQANENFLLLQEQIESLENQIKTRRGYYNEAVNKYNKEVQQFPGMIVAKVLEYPVMNYFEADEIAFETPIVEF